MSQIVTSPEIGYSKLQRPLTKPFNPRTRVPCSAVLLVECFSVGPQRIVLASLLCFRVSHKAPAAGCDGICHHFTIGKSRKRAWQTPPMSETPKSKRCGQHPRLCLPSSLLVEPLPTSRSSFILSRLRFYVVVVDCNVCSTPEGNEPY